MIESPLDAAEREFNEAHAQARDTLRRVLLDIATPGLAETIFAPFPRLRPLDPALCPVCFDATVEKGEVCGECASLPVIDLTVRRDIDCYEQEYAPASQRYGAVDRNTYDGEGRGNVIGMGATKASAIRDLLVRLAERDAK